MSRVWLGLVLLAGLLFDPWLGIAVAAESPELLSGRVTMVDHEKMLFGLTVDPGDAESETIIILLTGDNPAENFPWPDWLAPGVQVAVQGWAALGNQGEFRATTVQNLARPDGIGERTVDRGIEREMGRTPGRGIDRGIDRGIERGIDRSIDRSGVRGRLRDAVTGGPSGPGGGGGGRKNRR